MSETGRTKISEIQTFVYKQVKDVKLKVDVMLPETLMSKRIVGLIYFHGGGLTVGNRNSWHPNWLVDRVTKEGMAFITADYRLLPPARGYEIIEDIKDLFSFISNSLNQKLILGSSHDNFIDADSLVVAGSSAGGLCAYLAAIHAHPKPKGVVSLYGMGGDFLTHQYLSTKSTPFFRGREILDPSEFSEFLYPQSLFLVDVADSEPTYYPLWCEKPGYPSNPRVLLARLYLQMGSFIDYYTGLHNPSISMKLRNLLENGEPTDKLLFRSLIPDSHLLMFPQFNVTSSFPPSFLLHGELDSAVLVRESLNFHKLLKAAGVKTELRIIQGMEHSFDYEPDSEMEHSCLFQEVLDFISELLAV